jgi:hypothetical protein
MRAREFVINVPITIKINGDGDPEIDMNNHRDDSPKNPKKLDPNPVMVPPLQQAIELEKADAGKTSPVIDELTQDEENPDDEQDQYEQTID